MTDEQDYIPGDVLLDVRAACREIGGDAKPVHPSTLYRGVKSGRYSKPIKVAPNTARWVQRVLRNDIARLAAMP